MSWLAIVLWILGGLITLTLVFEFFVPRTRGKLVRDTITQKSPLDSWANTIFVFLVFLVIGGVIHLWDEVSPLRQPRK